MPILKEIILELDFQGVKETGNIEKWAKRKNIEQENSVSSYYTEVFKEKALKIRNESRHITSLYERFLPKIKTKDCKKIIVYCSPNKRNTILTNDGFCEISIKFDYEVYNLSSVETKKQIILETVIEALLELCEVKGWDKELFIFAYQKVKEVEFTNEWIQETKWNKNKKYKAVLSCVFEIDKFELFLEIYNKKGEIIQSKKVKNTAPSEFIFYNLLGKINWESEETITLHDRCGNKLETIEIKTPTN